jgi:hypothetical protein
MKVRLQKLIFPDGLILDIKNRSYLTKNINKLFQLIVSISDNLEGNKKDFPISLLESPWQ